MKINVKTGREGKLWLLCYLITVIAMEKNAALGKPGLLQSTGFQSQTRLNNNKKNFCLNSKGYTQAIFLALKFHQSQNDCVVNCHMVEYYKCVWSLICSMYSHFLHSLRLKMW